MPRHVERSNNKSEIITLSVGLLRRCEGVRQPLPAAVHYLRKHPLGLLTQTAELDHRWFFLQPGQLVQNVPDALLQVHPQLRCELTNRNIVISLSIERVKISGQSLLELFLIFAFLPPSLAEYDADLVEVESGDDDVKS